MKVTKLEKLLLLLVAFAMLVVWQSSSLVDHAAAGTDDTRGLSDRNDRPTPFTKRSFRRQQNSDNNHQSPFFVLHIGPPKTATTTIQCGLHHLSETLAAEDSIYFVGKTCPQLGTSIANNESAIAGHNLLMGLNGGNPNTRGYEALKSRMDYHRQRGNHMVYSNEGFANHMEDKNVTWQVLQSLFTDWNVRIVIGYRHYFEWIRSLYYQQYLNAKKYKLNWPNQGKGLEHPSFLWYLDYHLKCYETGNLSVDGGHHAPAFGHHLSLSTYKKFAPYFDDIQFFNLYEDHGDLVTNFVCDMLPVADKTCNMLQSKTSTKHENAQGLVHRVSKSFDAQRVAEAAYLEGMIDHSLEKPDVVELIEQKMEEEKMESNPQFLACPSESLEGRFMNASISFEKEMLSIHHDDLSEELLNQAAAEHKQLFQLAKAEFRFCEVDPELVLRDAEWVAFLTKVGKQAKS